MKRFAPWVGRWPNKHDDGSSDPEFYVDGALEYKLLAGGHFLGAFEKNVIRRKSGEVFNQKEVDLWGYCDSAKLYFRVDVDTYGPGPKTPEADDTLLWFQGQGKAVVLVAPLLEEKMGEKTVPFRVGFVLESPRTLRIFKQRLENGAWVDAPGGLKSEKLR
ncbi:MAG: hypothetical protein JO041_04445 [Acidobacteria bacterium]|nr:hypothetical protein [Acidobacteriota bacterium]